MSGTVRRRWAGAPAAVAAAALIAGCGPGAASPASSARPASSGPLPTQPAPARTAASRTAGAGPSPAQLARAQTTHELPTPHGRQTVAGGWKTPVQAVEVFAATYINWTATSVAGRLRALARVSVGQARAAVHQQASEVAADSELRHDGIANAGTVEAIGPLAGRAHRYAVVTRERTIATASDAYQGLAPAWHVAIATVTRTAHGLWVLSGWQPED